MAAGLRAHAQPDRAGRECVHTFYTFYTFSSWAEEGAAEVDFDAGLR